MVILQVLERAGAQTVPQIARARSTSRQTIQLLVNNLEQEGLVESAPNPAHKRSELVRITESGRKLLALEFEKEQEFLAQLAAGLSAEAVRRSTELLRALRESLVCGKRAVLESPGQRRARPRAAARPQSVGPAETLPEESELPVSLL